MCRGIEQRLMLVLTVELDELRGQISQRACGGQFAVDEGAAAALSGDFTPNQPFPAAAFEDRFNSCLLLAGSNQVIVDIHSRFLFENEVFARRLSRTLGVTELNELMLECQATAYADGLDQSTAHRYMWVLKPHYYASHFYNWPYTYGLLFGLGLHAQYQRDPERFRQGYDDLLGAVGLADAAELGRRFGIDVRDAAFWVASLDQVRARMAAYAELAVQLGAQP